jgi:hypothetical protein
VAGGVGRGNKQGSPGLPVMPEFTTDFKTKYAIDTIEINIITMSHTTISIDE